MDIQFKNFTEKVAQLPEQLLSTGIDNSDVVVDNNVVTYCPTGDTTCWICTLKHLGVAHEYASELQRYPHHFIKCIGALVCASRECPSSKGRTLLTDYYNECLSTGVVEDMNDLLKAVYVLFSSSSQ